MGEDRTCGGIDRRRQTLSAFLAAVPPAMKRGETVAVDGETRRNGVERPSVG